MSRSNGFAVDGPNQRIGHGAAASYVDHKGDAGAAFDGDADIPSAKRVPFLILLMLFSAIFLQRLAVPVGLEGTAIGILINAGAVCAMFIRGELMIAPLRIVFVLLLMTYALLSVTFNSVSGSSTSAALLIAMYLPFAFSHRSRDTRFLDVLIAYQWMMVVCASLGVAQFFLHFVISSKWLYTFEDTLPPSILLHGFATFIPISYGATIYRSNGFFMLEPSIFSQFVALAIIIELLFFQVKWRLGVYAAAILFAYSGTGLIALVLVPPILAGRRSFGIIATLGLVAGLAIATSNMTHMDAIQERASEFDSSNTSGYARFIAPAHLIERFVIPDPSVFAFGAGPGSIRDFIAIMPYATHDPVWAKVLTEYGVIGSILFWILYVTAVFIGSPSTWMSIALTIGFLSFGGELFDPRLSTLLLVFCVLLKRQNPAVIQTQLPFRMEAAPSYGISAVQR